MMQRLRQAVSLAGVSLDMEGFDAAMEAQRQRARAGGAKTSSVAGDDDAFAHFDPTEFVGYVNVQATAELLVAQGSEQTSSSLVIFDRTPFYAESGGQLPDHGSIFVGDDHVGDVVDVQKKNGVFVHDVEWLNEQPVTGETVRLVVDAKRRRQTAAHHTATHLLQAALREVLGSHVRQAGSRVEPTRLRFDFSHFAALGADERLQIEDRVNDVIRQDLAVTTTEMAYDEAVERGAMAFFGEKYGNIVRVVDVPGFSVELCGGTHVAATGEIGSLFVDSEGGVSAGVRRIEALVGQAALDRARGLEANLATIAVQLGVPQADVIKRIDHLLESTALVERELKSLKAQNAGAAAGQMVDEAIDLNGFKVLTRRLDVADVADLKQASDQLRERLPELVLFLIGTGGEQPILFASVPDDLTSRLHAGKALKAAANAMGGRGGGRPASAQGGGGEIAKSDAAIEAFRTFVEAV